MVEFLEPNFNYQYQECLRYKGTRTIITGGSDDSWEFADVPFHWENKELKLINKKGTTNMGLKQTWNAIKRGEPEKTFFKLGITDENDELTADGMALYQNWRFQQDKAQFKTDVADPIVEAQEEEKK